MQKRLFIFAIIVASAVPLFAQIKEGDTQWVARAEGHQGGRAKPERIDAAIAAYQRAVAQNPNDLEARWKLLRAMRFKTRYVASTIDEKKRIYSDLKTAGREALDVLGKQLAAKGVNSIYKANEKQVADAARTMPGAAEIFCWDSVNWGEWALTYGKLAAVREGAADRIRREATIAMLIDPRVEGGCPARVLGRLHDQTPKIFFLTPWVSKKDALRLLNESLKVDPTNKITQVFLAEAIVDNNSNDAPKAVQLLREIIAAPNNTNDEVEQAAATEDARALLKKLGA